MSLVTPILAKNKLLYFVTEKSGRGGGQFFRKKTEIGVPALQ